MEHTGRSGAGAGAGAAASAADLPLVATMVGTKAALTSAASPGPIYMPKFAATAAAAPRVVFGGAPREPSSKHADVGPGPGAYTLPVDRGVRPTIRGREHFGSATTAQAGVAGPGEYPRVETRYTTKRNPPKYSIKGRRIAKPPAFAVPAPNAHQKVEDTVKFQHLAKLTNAPRTVFGPPPRKRELSGVAASVFATPGPSEYVVDPGYKHMSTVPVPPAYSMVPRRPAPGTTERAGGYTITPDFHKPMEGVGKQALSTHKTAPAPTFSGRVKFGSPYMM